MIQKVFKNHIPILIEGESGTGKSFLANRIHKEAQMIPEQFFSLNLASLTDQLFESELFGHKKGSFTGAIDDKKGHFSLGRSATLFLDEIGELTLSQQKKLLEVLESGSFFPIGSRKADKLRAKLIFATNKNLKEEVRKGHFREDLFYRIRGYYIKMNPLREQSDKEKEIIFCQLNKDAWSRFSKELKDFFFNADWRGNIREAKMLMRLLALEEGVLQIEHIPGYFIAEENHKKLFNGNYHENLAQFEKEYFTQQLRYNKGKVNKTAKSSGVSKVTLINKLKRYNLDHEKFKYEAYRQWDLR